MVSCLLAWIKRHVLCTSCVCLITRSLRISSTKRNVGWGSQSPVRWTDIMVSLFFGSCRSPSPFQNQRPPPKNHTFLKSFTKVLFLMRSCSPRPSRSCYHHFNMGTQRNWVHKTQFAWTWIQIDMGTWRPLTSNSVQRPFGTIWTISIACLRGQTCVCTHTGSLLHYTTTLSWWCPWRITLLGGRDDERRTYNGLSSVVVLTLWYIGLMVHMCHSIAKFVDDDAVFVHIFETAHLPNIVFFAI